jgi:hypothetical protein
MWGTPARSAAIGPSQAEGWGSTASSSSRSPVGATMKATPSGTPAVRQSERLAVRRDAAIEI